MAFQMKYCFTSTPIQGLRVTSRVARWLGLSGSYRHLKWCPNTRQSIKYPDPQLLVKYNANSDLRAKIQVNAELEGEKHVVLLLLRSLLLSGTIQIARKRHNQMTIWAHLYKNWEMWPKVKKICHFSYAFL